MHVNTRLRAYAIFGTSIHSGGLLVIPLSVGLGGRKSAENVDLENPK